MYRYILDIQIYTVQSGHSRKSVVFSNLYSKILVVLQNYHSRVTVGAVVRIKYDDFDDLDRRREGLALVKD